MSDKIREATLEAIEKKWTEAARLWCIDAFPSALNEAWQSALAQQPSPAVPDGWKLVPVELTPEMYSAFGYVKSVPFDIWKKVLAAAPAPAAQEPAAWDVFYADDDRLAHTVRTKAEADRYSGMAYYVKPLHYIAPPAAEQPDTVKVPRELLACAARSCANGWVDYPTAKELRALLGKEGEA